MKPEDAAPESCPSFTLQRDAWGDLVMIDAQQRRVVGVRAVRAFPISAPEGHLSLCDAEGRELLSIEDRSLLPAQVRQILDEEVARSDFLPVVVRIQQVLADRNPSQWQITTDRGPTTFLMEDADNDVRRLGPTRILLVDTHGIRYLIPDTRRLDPASRRILDRYL
jgi:hypothetical protein